MPSVIRGRYAGPGFTRWRKRRHGPHWYVRYMIRAITEGWPLPPEKRGAVVESLYGVTQGIAPDGVDRITAADVVAAARALMKGSEMELAEAKIESDRNTANQPKVIVVRRVDVGPAPPALESGEGDDRGEPL